MIEKVITLTFVEWSYCSGLELLFGIEKGNDCIHEHTLFLGDLPKASQLRFLCWVMSQDWHYRFSQTRGNHDYDNWHIFSTGQNDNRRHYDDGLRHFLDEVVKGEKAS